MPRTRKPAKIEDVAEAAGVSIMTVSRAIRGIEGVSEKKRAEVLSIARKMNYTPNSAARSLAVNNSNLVGISLPTFAGEVFADILKGMRGTFESAGYASVIDTTEYDIHAEKAWVERLLSWQPAAVILTGTHHHPQVRERLENARVPVLQVWDHTDDPIDLNVGIDHFEAGRHVGDYLVALGYRRPGFIGAPKSHDMRADARIAGLRAAFDGIASVAVARPALGNAFATGHGGMEQLLAQDGPGIDVVFFLNDHMAFGGMMACEARGVRVPEDMGIVGFNGLDLNSVLPVELTTVATPRKLMGITGARNLLARIHGVEAPRSVALPVKIQPGKTTRAQPPNS
ncbi:LacI family transcriptional regulator [Litoreibacter ponti]|uniref:LacI family transcriptional regulator n=1 Tax=Litoreibacter ponti TaxID=1510457 RepID=A0A2T6BFU2_9RHOB|nr:LacI family DNA-binding transcriptional regulator [Litoreibacter ponti]PTX54932.1 LacI family transcriptional regulator [Litoreibacter ponti]